MKTRELIELLMRQDLDMPAVVNVAVKVDGEDSDEVTVPIVDVQHREFGGRHCVVIGGEAALHVTTNAEVVLS